MLTTGEKREQIIQIEYRLREAQTALKLLRNSICILKEDSELSEVFNYDGAYKILCELDSQRGDAYNIIMKMFEALIELKLKENF